MSNSILEKTKETNDLGYAPLPADQVQPLQDFILVAWDLCQRNIKAGKHVLIRPETHNKQHYTGKVLAVGPDVDPDIEVGSRIVFDQFSNFEKYWDDELGRVALLQESMQGPLFMIVPERVEIEGTEGDFNYDV